MKLVWLLLLVGVWTGCKKNQGYATKGNYPAEIAKIIIPNCATAGCHDAISYEGASGLDLSTWGGAFKGTRNGAAIIPYSAEYSTLTYFINTYAELGLQNQPTMPLNGNKLSYQEVQTIKNWIQSGAPSDEGTISDEGLEEVGFVVNQGCDVITVMRRSDGVPIRYIPCGTKASADIPHQIKVSPDKKYFYVVFINNNIIQQFRCSDYTWVKNIPLTPAAAGTGFADALDWNTLTLSRDGKRAYCVSWTQSGHIAAVDLEQGQLLHYLGGQHYPHGVCLDNSQQFIYVTAQTGNFITRIDTGFTASELIPLSGNNIEYGNSLNIHEVIPSTDGKQLWVTCQGTHEVRVLDLASLSVVRVIPVGQQPQEIVYSGLTECYYTTCIADKNGNGSGALSKIKAGSYEAETLTIGFQPHGLAVDEKYDQLWLASRNIDATGPTPHHTSVCGGRNGFIQFLSLSQFKDLGKKFEVSADPYSIFVR